MEALEASKNMVYRWSFVIMTVDIERWHKIEYEENDTHIKCSFYLKIKISSKKIKFIKCILYECWTLWRNYSRRDKDTIDEDTVNIFTKPKEW